MFRLLYLLLLVAAILTLGAGAAWAEESVKWNAFPFQGNDWRGLGHYLSWIKIAACWLTFLAWVWTGDWVNRDLQENNRLDYLRWNPLIFGTFLAALLLVGLLPYFWIGFPLLWVAYLVPLLSYVVYRNARVPSDQRVLTPAHVRYWLSQRLAKVGVTISAEAADPHSEGPPVKLLARGGPDERQEQARLLSARQSPGVGEAREILAAGLTCRATVIVLDYSPQSVAVRYMVDGVWLSREPEQRLKADPALLTLKLLCGLNPEDRRTRQEGTFAVEYEGIHYAGTLACQGTKTGERAALQFDERKVRFASLEELGMRDKMQKQLEEVLHVPRGLMLFSAAPGNGLRTTMHVVLRNIDRMTREFVAVEADTQRYEEIENVPVVVYQASAGQNPLAVLPKVFRTDPNVVVVRDLVDGETISLLCEEACKERLILSTVRAKDSTEALLQVLALRGPAAEFAAAIVGVLSQRLVRKLCGACKEAYVPTPEILKQLGIPEGRISAFYRPPQQSERVCPECAGVGYQGQTAIFELLVVGETVRKVLANSPRPELLRSAARKDGMRSLEEEGVLMVAKGITSLPELLRVLKQ